MKRKIIYPILVRFASNQRKNNNMKNKINNFKISWEKMGFDSLI